MIPITAQGSLNCSYDGIFMERLEEIGSMPLPPYISRPAEDSDKEMYQTVYSRIDGSVVALHSRTHFTKSCLQRREKASASLMLLFMSG